MQTPRKKPPVCDCCNTEFNFSSDSQELLSIYRTSDIRWICDECVIFANKEVNSARSIAVDIQKNYVIRALTNRRNNFKSATHSPKQTYNPISNLMFKIYTNVIFYIAATILLFITTASIVVLEPTVIGILLLILSIGSFVLLTYLFSKKISGLIGALIADSERKSQDAIESIMEISNEAKLDSVDKFSNDFRVKGHSLDTQSYMNPFTGQMSKIISPKKKSP